MGSLPEGGGNDLFDSSFAGVWSEQSSEERNKYNAKMCDEIFCMLVNVFSESFEMSAADERGCIRALINSSHFLVKLSTFQRKSGVASMHLLTVIFLWNFFLSLNVQPFIGNVSK